MKPTTKRLLRDIIVGSFISITDNTDFIHKGYMPLYYVSNKRVNSEGNHQLLINPVNVSTGEIDVSSCRWTHPDADNLFYSWHVHDIVTAAPSTPDAASTAATVNEIGKLMVDFIESVTTMIAMTDPAFDLEGTPMAAVNKGAWMDVTKKLIKLTEADASIATIVQNNTSLQLTHFLNNTRAHAIKHRARTNDRVR